MAGGVRTRSHALSLYDILCCFHHHLYDNVLLFSMGDSHVPWRLKKKIGEESLVSTVRACMAPHVSLGKLETTVSVILYSPCCTTIQY